MSALSSLDARPRLPRGVRLRQDKVRGGHVLLAPESVVHTDPVAVAVLERCDGSRTVTDIVGELVSLYRGDRAAIERDVCALLASLARRRLVAF